MKTRIFAFVMCLVAAFSVGLNVRWFQRVQALSGAYDELSGACSELLPRVDLLLEDCKDVQKSYEATASLLEQVLPHVLPDLFEVIPGVDSAAVIHRPGNQILIEHSLSLSGTGRIVTFKKEEGEVIIFQRELHRGTEFDLVNDSDIGPEMRNLSGDILNINGVLEVCFMADEFIDIRVNPDTEIDMVFQEIFFLFWEKFCGESVKEIGAVSGIP